MTTLPSSSRPSPGPRASVGVTRGAAVFAALFLFACGNGTAATPPVAPNGPCLLSAPSATCHRIAPTKIAQITGDEDKETTPPTPTLNQTATRVGLVGTDLGYSFVHRDKLHFLFGDGTPVHPSATRPMDSDPMALLDGPIPDPSAPPPVQNGLKLEFLTDTDGEYLPARLDGNALGTNQLPMTGFSAGNDVYVFFSAGGYVISVSHDDGRTYSTVAPLPSPKLQNVVPVILDSAQVPNLPANWDSAQTVLVFGRHKMDAIYLAAAPMARFADTSTWVFFSSRQGGVPSWDPSEAKALPLFAPVADSACNGGFSLTPLPQFGRWLMLNRCDGPSAILYRVAPDLFSAWSEERVFFDKHIDGGIGHFMHAGCDSADTSQCADTNFTAEYESPDGSVWGPKQEGYPYAPYVIQPFTRWDATARTFDLYFLMSVWNPYSPMLMKATIAEDQVE